MIYVRHASEVVLQLDKILMAASTGVSTGWAILG